MPNRVRVLTVPDRDRAELDRRARDRGAAIRVVERARIALLAEGLTGPQIADWVGCTESTVGWAPGWAQALTDHHDVAGDPGGCAIG